MNRLLLTLLLVLLLFSCHKNEPISILANSQLLLQRTKAADGRLQNEFDYDARGKVLSQKTYSPGRKTPDEITYAYDRQGRLERVETTTLGLRSCSTCEGPAMKFLQTFEYDGNGRLARTKNVNENGWVASEWRYEYNDSGQLVRQNSVTQTGAKGNSIAYTYDTRGNITKTETFSADGRLTNRDTYEFDQRPNPYRLVYLGSYAAIFRSPNNAVRVRNEFLAPGGSPPSENTIRYEYDPITGYPVRAEEKNGSVSVFEYQ